MGDYAEGEDDNSQNPEIPFCKVRNDETNEDDNGCVKDRNVKNTVLT